MWKEKEQKRAEKLLPTPHGLIVLKKKMIISAADDGQERSLKDLMSSLFDDSFDLFDVFLDFVR